MPKIDRVWTYESGTQITTIPTWTCEYCGSLHPVNRYECRNCGAPRKAEAQHVGAKPPKVPKQPRPGPMQTFYM
jgi:uncharacterized OB-fold protein